MVGAIRVHKLASEQLGTGSVCHTVGDSEAGLWVLWDEDATKASCPNSPGSTLCTPLTVHILHFQSHQVGGLETKRLQSNGGIWCSIWSLFPRVSAVRRLGKPNSQCLIAECSTSKTMGHYTFIDLIKGAFLLMTGFLCVTLAVRELAL